MFISFSLLTDIILIDKHNTTDDLASRVNSHTFKFKIYEKLNIVLNAIFISILRYSFHVGRIYLPLTHHNLNNMKICSGGNHFSHMQMVYKFL